MAKKLTQAQLEVSHAWLHDIFILGGLIPASKQLRSNYRYMYGGTPTNGSKQYSDVICQAIMKRQVDYQEMIKIDAGLRYFKDLYFLPALHTVDNYSVKRLRKPPEMLAAYIANLCSERKYYWDDRIASTYEMDQIKNNTIIGKALWDFNCFTSQQNAANKTTTSATRASSPRQPGTPPQNNYKSSGSQSQNVKCLIGQPNNKVLANTSILYCIEANKIGKNTPNAFIKPLDAKACPGGKAIVYLGSGNGYTDCKCWFDNLGSANYFLTQVQNKYDTKFTNIHVSKSKVDNNGYYVTDTEFGPCMIKASKLNEALKESEEQNNTNKPMTVYVDALDDFSEALLFK